MDFIEKNKKYLKEILGKLPLIEFSIEDIRKIQKKN